MSYDFYIIIFQAELNMFAGLSINSFPKGLISGQMLW